MGLLETIKGIFGSSASEKKEEPVSIDEAEALIKKRKDELEKGLVVKSSSKIAEIKHLLRSIEAELNEMDKRNLMEEGDSKPLKLKDNGVTLSLRPFEIATLLIET